MRILDSYLFEIAYHKKKAIESIRSTAWKRIEHLVKIFLYYSVRKNDIEHWIKEIVNWSNKSPVLKGNKRLKEQDLIKILWDEPKDNFSSSEIRNFWVKEFQNNGYPEVWYNESSLQQYLKEFHIWLSQELSKGNISSCDIHDKILELVKKYKE